ncbi:MAG TPA: hypothetical protein VFI27_06240 [candidate division Zixibacteria bacterium]|nr:hypothetical protein [candidate division Zixibacteria bacterium]
MNEFNRKLTLDQAVTYEIRVPGELNERWVDWVENMLIAVEIVDDEMPISTLTGTLDQAALQGLLRRLYSLGLPLLSVICVEIK